MILEKLNYDVLHRDVWSNDLCMSDKIRRNVIWEEKVVMAIIDNARPFSTILDIGSHIGLTALTVNMLSSNNKIICFEPFHNSFELLNHNTQGISNITTENYGFSDEPREVQMIERKDYPCMNEIYNNKKLYSDDYNHDKKKEVCQFYCLDSLDPMEPISVVKIDVESHEYEVLKGGLNFLEKFQPVIIIEIFDENFNKVNTLLNENGYFLSEKLDSVVNYIYKPFN